MPSQKLASLKCHYEMVPYLIDHSAFRLFLPLTRRHLPPPPPHNLPPPWEQLLPGPCHQQASQAPSRACTTISDAAAASAAGGEPAPSSAAMHGRRLHPCRPWEGGQAWKGRGRRTSPCAGLGCAMTRSTIGVGATWPWTRHRHGCLPTVGCRCRVTRSPPALHTGAHVALAGARRPLCLKLLHLPS